MNKSIIFTLLFLVLASITYGQSHNIMDARRNGFKILKQPNIGVLVVDVTEEYRNIATVATNHMQWSCYEDFHITMTTAKGRVQKMDSCNLYSLGLIAPNEYPVTVEARIKNSEGIWIEFAVQLLYEGFRYEIQLRRE